MKKPNVNHGLYRKIQTLDEEAKVDENKIKIGEFFHCTSIMWKRKNPASSVSYFFHNIPDGRKLSNGDFTVERVIVPQLNHSKWSVWLVEPLRRRTA
jgi:hypothetical protein